MPTSVPLSSASQAIGRPRDEGGLSWIPGGRGALSPELGTYPGVPGAGSAHHLFEHPYPTP